MNRAKKRRNIIAATGTVVFVVLLGGCSDESVLPVPKRDAAIRSEALAFEPVQAVPDDAAEFHAEASVDASGKILRRRLELTGAKVVVGFEASALPPKLSEPVVFPEKVNSRLSERLRPNDPAATTEVVVSIAHNAPLAPLTKLRRDQPRESVENSSRLASRAAEIATVERLRKPYRDAVIARVQAMGGSLDEELALGNGIAIRIPDAAVGALATDPNVLDISPRYDGTSPPGSISDGGSLATGMNSDYWRPWMDGFLNSFYVATLDTGVRSTHTLFTSPDRGILGLHGDCANGNSSCSNSPINPLYNDQDNVWNHGTGVASIIMGGNSTSPGFGLNFRGISKTQLDYYNVYKGLTVGLDAVAVTRGFTKAINNGADVIVAEVQSSQGDSGVISLAADDAFDAGVAVLGACGNTGAVTAPAAPGNAHKVLSIGDYDAVSGAVVSQVPGTVDGRAKPDIQAPTNVSGAGNASDTAYSNMNGTSGATAFAGGAAAIMYEWLNHAFGLSNKPGNLYATLLAQGNGGTLVQPNGAGKLKLRSASEWKTGQVTLGTTAIEVDYTIGASRKDLSVAIWWPEGQSQAHNDVDLSVKYPNGTSLGSSITTHQVWEKVSQTGNLPAGTYKIRFVPYTMPRPNQVVYYTAVSSHQ